MTAGLFILLSLLLGNDLEYRLEAAVISIGRTVFIVARILLSMNF
jgi:hypothetical protein